jgi:hypothetical protein
VIRTPEHNKIYMILNLAVGGSGGGTPQASGEISGNARELGQGERLMPCLATFARAGYQGIGPEVSK